MTIYDLQVNRPQNTLNHAVLEKRLGSWCSRIVKWLKALRNFITEIFYKIFCLEKHSKNFYPEVDNVKKYVENPSMIYQFPGVRIRNQAATEDCKKILKGERVDIQLTPIEAKAGKVGSFEFPSSFSKDLHRTTHVLIKPPKSSKYRMIYQAKNDTPKAINACCQQIIDVLGKNAAIASARLLSQAGYFLPYSSFLTPILDYKDLIMNGCEDQFNIKLKNEDVVLKMKRVFYLKWLNEPKPFRYIGIEVKYTIPHEELEWVGAFSPETLKNMPLEEIAPSAVTQYTYTKAYENIKSAYKDLKLFR